MFSTRLFPKLAIISFVFLAVAIVLVPRQASALGPQCTVPYMNVQGAGSAPTTDPTGELTIERVNVGEPFDGNCNDKSITFVLKVKTMDPGNTGQVTPQYNAVWTVQFAASDTSGTTRTLFVVWHTETVPTGTFSYGFVDTSTGQTINRTFICAPPALTCPVTGTVAPNGTIAITLNTSAALTFTPQVGSAFSVNLGNPPTNLSSIKGITYICACAGGSGAVSTQSQTVGNGTYTSNGNVACSAPPVAALSANPTSGNAPLPVNFDASGSNIPAGGCGTINSYIFDFGDSTGVTQPTPATSHTYTVGGATYPARVRVTSSDGITSANIAEQDIMVSGGVVQLTSVVSRMTHTGVGDFDIVLPQPPATPRGVESRSSASQGAGNYKMIFTFLNNLVSVVTATVTSHDPVSGVGSVLNSGLGPNANQYTVNLTGVSTGQYITVTLAGAHDSTGATNDITGTMGVLVGDVNFNGVASNADVSLVKAQVAAGGSVDPLGSNFRDDVNANGVISNADVSLTKAQVAAGAALPSPP